MVQTGWYAFLLENFEEIWVGWCCKSIMSETCIINDTFKTFVINLKFFCETGPHAKVRTLGRVRDEEK